MSAIIDVLSKHLGSDSLYKLSDTLKTDPVRVQKGVSAALPLLIGALGRNADDNRGAQSIAAALDRDHDGSILNNLGSLLSGAVSGRAADGDGILSHVLGSRRSNVEQGVSRASGLDLGTTAQLLVTLAPLVMGALGREKREQNLDTSGVRDLLKNEREQSESKLGSFGRLLDRDGDGEFTDDLLSIGSKVFGGALGR